MPYTYSTAELAAINTAYTNGDWQAAYAAALAVGSDQVVPARA